MKKLIAVVLVLMMICGSALACDGVILPKVEENAVAGVFTGCSDWAVVADYRELAGIKSPDEALVVLPLQTVESNYIRGFAQGGLIRAKVDNKGCAVTLLSVSETVVGLKRLDNVVFRVRPEYLGLVAEITDRRTGNELSAATIAASTLWMVSENVTAHIFWRDEADVFPVIDVTFNGGQNSTIIWAGDFDGDGYLELGFKFGIPFPSAPKATEEPEPEKECKKVVVTKTVITQQSSGIDISIRIGTFVRTVVTTCVKVFQMCCKK